MEEVKQPTVLDALGDYGKDMLGLTPDNNGQEERLQATEEIKSEPTPTADKPVEAMPQTPSQASVVPAPAAEDWFAIQKFNERFGLEVQTEDEIKEAIRSLNDNKEYIDKKNYYSELEKVVDDMQEHLSTVKMFGSKENYEKAMIVSHLSESIPEPIAQTVMATDFKTADNLHCMFLEAISRDPNLMQYASEEDIKKGLLARIGVDIADPDFTLAEYNKAAKLNPQAVIGLSMGGTEAKKFFSGLVEEAKKSVPEIKDWKQEINNRAQQQVATVQKRTADWTDKAKELADQFKEFTILEKDATGKDVVDFTFAVPKEFQSSVANYLKEFAVSKGLDVTPETVVALKAEIQDAFEDQYKNEIRKAYVAEKMSKFKEEMDNKVFNNKPISTQEAPEGHAKSYQDELDEQRKRFGLK